MAEVRLLCTLRVSAVERAHKVRNVERMFTRTVELNRFGVGEQKGGIVVAHCLAQSPQRFAQIVARVFFRLFGP